MLETRMSKIIEKLEKYGNVEVKQLSAEFGVTEKTIRYDLSRMEKMGLLKRVHGGAVINIKQTEDAYFNPMRTTALHDKEQIARAAFDYIKSVGTENLILFLDAGSSTYEFSRYLRNLSSLIIITNDLLIAANLNHMDGSLHVTGGTLANNVNRYLVGADAIAMINNHYTSMCFVGASSLGAEKGFFTYTDEDAQIKQAAMARSSLSICLADHTKFSQTAFVKYADCREIDIIITDEKAPADQVSAFEKQGVKVIVAK